MAVTVAITLRDNEGNVIYTKTGLAVNSSNTYFVDANNYPLQLPLSGAYTVDAALSGGQAVTQQTIGVRLLIED